MRSRSLAAVGLLALVPLALGLLRGSLDVDAAAVRAGVLLVLLVVLDRVVAPLVDDLLVGPRRRADD